MGKKKRPNPVTEATDSEGVLKSMMETSGEVPVGTAGNAIAVETCVSESNENIPCFKNPKWTNFGKMSGSKRPRVWKSLKQICTSERVLFGQDVPSYSSLDCPASKKCAKKYSDVSSLISKYTDPETKLRYTNAKEFRKIRSLPPDIVQGYLSLRKANNLT